MPDSPLLPFSSSPARRRYAIVGLGSRHELYQDGIETAHARWAELVGVCDSNVGRVELARRYVHLLRDHIDNENGVLFPLADAVLDPAAQLLVARAFEQIEAEQGPAASSEHAESRVDRLAAALGDRV